MNIMINSGRTSPFQKSRKRLLEKLQKNGHKIFLTGSEDLGNEAYESLNVHFDRVRLKRTNITPFLDILLILKYIKIIKKNNIELVHSYTIKPNIYGSIAARICGVKKVFPTINGIGYVFTSNTFKAKVSRFFAKRLYKFAFKKVHTVFFHNVDDCELFIDLGIVQKSKTQVIDGTGIDVNFFRPTSFPNRITFLFASRLLISKGIIEFLEAANFVHELYPEVKFLVAGALDDNPESVEKSYIQKIEKQGVIEYAGYQEDMRNLISCSSVVVLPSYREGVPHIILEAMAMGRPVITTLVPGCKETVVNGQNGFLVPAHNSQEIGFNMIRFILNPQFIVQMGLFSRNLAMNRFNVEIVNKNIISSFECKLY